MKPLTPLIFVFCVLNAHAAVLYECESMGARFYSSGDCATHRAVIVTRHKVPDGLPFEQQVSMVQQRDGNRSSAISAANQAYDRNNQCAWIEHQLKQLQEKYTNWQYKPVDEVNGDQARERDLKTKRSSLGCASR